MLRRRMSVMLGVALLVVLALGGYKAWSVYGQIQQFKAPKPPVSVAVAAAESRSWEARLSAVGSLRAIQGVDLSLEVAGTVKALRFDSGQQVKAGQKLLELDSDVEAALLGTAQADLGLAQVDYGRGAQLVGSQAISKGEFDRLAAQFAKNKATVAQLKASLAKKSIVAPFSGTLGIRQVDVGDYLASGTVIVTLQDLTSLYVDFNLPEQNVPRLALKQQVHVAVSAYPGQVFVGAISAINPKVDLSTRNVQIRATLPNPDGKLLPGMFADVQVVLPAEAEHVVVPESSIAYTLYGNSVYVAAPKAGTESEQLIAQRRFVDTGEHRDGWVAIGKGLKPGERVVTAGQLKLSDGTPVSIATQEVLPLDTSTPATSD